MQKQLSVGVALKPLAIPDTVIGDQTSTYVLTPGGNPFYVDAGITIATTAGDGVDGASGTRWTLSNAGTIDGDVAGVSLQSRGAITNTGAIAGANGSGVVLGAGGAVTNRKGATIEGTPTYVSGGDGGLRSGVYVHAGSGNVINGGTIGAPVGPGVRMLAGGKVTNWGGGGIYGATGVSIAGAAGAVRNGGYIVGATGGGVVLNNGGRVIDWANGMIVGPIGVHIEGGAGRVSNGGDIVGLGASGVLLSNGGEITNTSHGTISSSMYGVEVAGKAGTVVNAGSIGLGSAIGTVGVKLAAGGDLTNENGGRISGAIGVELDQSGNVVNAKGGIIAGGVELNQSGNVTNAKGARITGVISFNLGGNLANMGTVAGAGPSNGVVIDNGAGTVMNGGLLTGGLDATVELFSSAVFHNLAAGRVIGGLGVGAYGTGTSTNAGQIEGGYAGVEIRNGLFENLASGQIGATNTNELNGGIGVKLGSGTLENFGTISSGYGVSISSGSSVINELGGSILGRRFGIAGGSGYLANNGVIDVSDTNGFGLYLSNSTVVNSGTVEGATATTFSAPGAIAMTGGGKLSNKTGGLILGSVELSNGDYTVVNAGSIDGSLFGLGSTDIALVLQTGSAITAATVQTATLQGVGMAAELDANSVTKTQAGTWELSQFGSFETATVNGGVLQVGDATHTDANLVVSGVLINYATIEVAAGTMQIEGGVLGFGNAIIAGGTLELGSTFNEAVDFTGTSGVLQLAKSQAYAGSISGFSLTGGTSLDLRDIGFTSGSTTASYVDNGAHTGGVLTVTDGTHTAHIKLIGDFSASTFTTSGDGNGGTTVVDPQTKPADVSPLIAAMASFCAPGGDMVPTAESGRWQPAFLAAAHHAG